MGNPGKCSARGNALLRQRAFLTLLALSAATTVGGQPPYAENQWHRLTCGVVRDVRWICSWEVQGDGGGAFQPVTVGTDLVKMGTTTLPGDLNVYLNDVTKGTYRCSCRMTGEQSARTKVIVFYSAAQRFRNVPDNVTLEEGKPSNISGCYLRNLPESANLSSITLVEEATGNKTTAPLDLRDYCAYFPLKGRQPGLYHFEVNIVHGAITSRSFNISLQAEAPPPPPPPPGPIDNGTMDSAWRTSIIAVFVSIGVLILLAVPGVLTCVIIGWRAWRRRKKREGLGALQPLGTGDIDMGSVHSDLHQLHHAQAGSCVALCGNGNATSVPGMPTEETVSHPFSLKPIQMEEKSNSECVDGGLLRLDINSGAAGFAAVREGETSEVQTRDPPSPPAQNVIVDSEGGPDVSDC